ncbi:hypothetical protein O3P69_001717 [Scylla paramamosain]|uniref:WAP domain-containing protein n=1 Tax=Scylla paramamosain TaxID=85552 RepID=A0AAW0UZA8_SCYPA
MLHPQHLSHIRSIHPIPSPLVPLLQHLSLHSQHPSGTRSTRPAPIALVMHLQHLFCTRSTCPAPAALVPHLQHPSHNCSACLVPAPPVPHLFRTHSTIPQRLCQHSLPAPIKAIPPSRPSLVASRFKNQQRDHLHTTNPAALQVASLSSALFQHASHCDCRRRGACGGAGAKGLDTHEKNAFYCCDFGIGTVGKPFATHPGKCPHRPICPEGLYTRGPAPTVCAHDGQCSKHEKCCADACLEHHTCLLADP